MYTQSGGMAWMSDGFTLDSNVKGGLMKGLGRMFSGESLFMATYTASRPDSTIAFASTVPGKILAIDTAKTSLICQKGAFLCAQTTVEINTVLTKKFTAGFFGGEGFIMQKFSGNGTVFAEFDGHVVEYELQAGQQIVVDTGHLAGMTASCKMEIRTVPGVKNMIFGGEGFFNTVVTGPGRIWLQTMPISNVAAVLRNYITTAK